MKFILNIMTKNIKFHICNPGMNCMGKGTEMTIFACVGGGESKMPENVLTMKGVLQL